MDKTELIELGLTEEQADSVLKSHKDDLSGKYIPKTRFDEVNTQLTTTRDELAKRDSQLSTLETVAKDNKELSDAIQALKVENEKQETEYQAKVSDIQKRSAVALMLADDVHDASLVMGLLDLKQVQVSPSGEVAGLKGQVDKLKEEKPFLFVETADDDGSEDGMLHAFRVRGKQPPESKGSGKLPKTASPEDIGKQFAARKKAAVAAMQAADKHYFNTIN